MAPLYTIIAALGLIGLVILGASLSKKKGPWDKLGRMIIVVMISTPLLLVALLASIVGLLRHDSLFVVYLITGILVLIPCLGALVITLRIWIKG